MDPSKVNSAGNKAKPALNDVAKAVGDVLNKLPDQIEEQKEKTKDGLEEVFFFFFFFFFFFIVD